MGLHIKKLTSSANKQARISALEPYVNQGRIRFTKRHHLLLDQLRVFPLGVHDDGAFLRRLLWLPATDRYFARRPRGRRGYIAHAVTVAVRLIGVGRLGTVVLCVRDALSKNSYT